MFIISARRVSPSRHLGAPDCLYLLARPGITNGEGKGPALTAMQLLLFFTHLTHLALMLSITACAGRWQLKFLGAYQVDLCEKKTVTLL